MGSQENFALRWNDFHANITSSFKHLRSSPDFQDVTLMCGIDTEIRAHKVILSACSPYFQSILCHISSPNPVVVMPHDVQYEEVVRLIDFMYHGEVAIPSQDINRFLSVAEQFQVRGLVENVPKVTTAAVAPSGSKFVGKNPAKRPRVVKEDLTSDEDYEGTYQPLAPEAGPTMVGLVCPKCRTMCRGVAALKAHMAVCPEQQLACEVCDASFQNQRALDVHMKKDHYRPVGQVAPAQRERTRGMINKQPGVQNFPKLANNPSLGISKVGGQPKSETVGVSAGTSMFNPRPARRSSNTGGSSRQPPTSTPAPPTHPRGGKGGKGKPDLREIGQKLGLAVSITSVASNSPRKGGAVAEQAAQAEANAEHIKEEPADVEETEVVEELGEGQEYVDEEYNQEGDGYEGEMVEGYEEGGEMEEGEYGEGEEGYPGYDDYGGGQHGQGEGSGQMFKKFQD